MNKYLFVYEYLTPNSNTGKSDEIIEANSKLEAYEFFKSKGRNRGLHTVVLNIIELEVNLN